MQGREPRIKTDFTYLSQSSGDGHYNYSGFLLKAGGRADITLFLTAEAGIGLERYRHHETRVDGTFYKLSLQGRFDPTRRIDAEWKYHDFEQAEADSEFLLQYSIQNGDLLITPGIRRALKYDSLLAVTGDTDEVSQRKIGSARSNTAFCKFAHQGEIYHYDKDNSVFNDSNDEPYAGGYFSPDLFIHNVLHLEAGYQLRQDSELRFSIRPRLPIQTGGYRWR